MLPTHAAPHGRREGEGAELADDYQDKSNDLDEDVEITMSPNAEESFSLTLDQLISDGYQPEPDEDNTPNA